MGWVVIVALIFGFVLSGRTQGNPLAIALGLVPFGLGLWTIGAVFLECFK